MEETEIALKYIIDKYNLDTSIKSPITIPNFSRYDLANLFAELKFSKGVEVGVQNANYSKVLCDAIPTMEFYAIDPWPLYDGLPNLGYDNSVQKLKSYEHCTVIRKKSMDAVQDFPDEYFDFVYVDGDHEFASATNDISEWIKKIRIGGIIAGHDYRPYYPKSFIHVYQVVNAFTNGYDIHPWFITDYVAERVRSFFWVKSCNRRFSGRCI